MTAEEFRKALKEGRVSYCSSSKLSPKEAFDFLDCNAESLCSLDKKDEVTMEHLWGAEKVTSHTTKPRADIRQRCR